MRALIADMTMLVEIPTKVRKSRTPFWGLPHSSLLSLAEFPRHNSGWERRKRRRGVRGAMEDLRRIPGRTESGRRR